MTEVEVLQEIQSDLISIKGNVSSLNSFMNDLIPLVEGLKIWTVAVFIILSIGVGFYIGYKVGYKK